jgi:hypothetical protein
LWVLDGVDGVNDSENCSGTLELRDEKCQNGDYYAFSGGCGGENYSYGGCWSIEENFIRMECAVDCDGQTRRGAIAVNSDGMSMSITSNANEGVVSLFFSSAVKNPKENFRRKN